MKMWCMFGVAFTAAVIINMMGDTKPQYDVLPVIGCIIFILIEIAIAIWVPK